MERKSNPHINTTINKTLIECIAIYQSQARVLNKHKKQRLKALLIWIIGEKVAECQGWNTTEMKKSDVD